MAKYKLKDLSLSKLEYGSGAAACDFNGDTRYVRITDITDDGKLATDVVSPSYYEEKHILHDGDILFARTGATVGKTFLYRNDYGKCVYAGFLIRMVPDKSKVLPAYIYYFTKSPRYSDFVSSNMKVVAQPNINAKQYGDLEIDVPSFAEQKEVVGRLAKIDGLIALRQEQLAKLDQLVKSRFVEMFENIITCSPKVFLEDISDFVTVGIANSATHAYADDGIVMLRNQNIKENYLDDNDLIYITPEFAGKYGSKQLAENDILVIRTGYPGVACLVPKKYEGCQTFTTLIVRLKDSSKVHANFVCHYINSSFGKDYVEQSKVGVAQQNFGAKSLAKMPIMVPSMELQAEFAEFTRHIMETKLTIQASLDKLELLKKSLMQEYFG